MIMTIHPSADGTMLELDVWMPGGNVITFARATREQLDRIVRVITRSKRGQ